jgi:hypothetical protein
MSRARNIKPGFFKNDILAECSPLARILFCGLWCEADREGRLEDRVKRIKADCLPYDDCDVDALLNQLAERGFIDRYAVDGCAYIQVVEFRKHQNPHVKEAASTIPEHNAQPADSKQEQVLPEAAPDKSGASLVQDTAQTGTSPADSLLLIPDSLQEIPTAVPAVVPAEPIKPANPKAKRPPTITEWLDSLGDADAIPATDPVYDYAAKVGIPEEYLRLSWIEFKAAYTASGKRQKDFPKTYRNAVRGNWYKLWWFSPEGDCRLATPGVQAMRAAA